MGKFARKGVVSMKNTKEKKRFTILGLASIFLLLLASQTLAQGMFVPTGNMTGPRWHYHTATLLPDGKVLIAGGINSPDWRDRTSSAELYDPSTGSFTATGSMSTPRANHTATLLNNGKVLITGGVDCCQVHSSAELYDPSTGTFTATGSMSGPRNSHAAILLPNGRVLVAGGGGLGGPPIASAEIYDPDTGTFTLTGSMSTKRTNVIFAAALLNDGKVLFAGGQTENGVRLASAELYDPLSGTFSLTGSMSTIRDYTHAILLANGNVLVVGGVDAYNNRLASAELYDPLSGTFSLTGSMSTSRLDHAATLLNNGTVLVTGGHNGSFTEDSAEIYDPGTGTFTATGSMSSPRMNHMATLLANGEVLIAGGTLGPPDWDVLDSAELYTLNQPPVAVCQDVTVAAGSSCTASASIDNGSYDPDGDPITLTQSPAEPYGLGTTSVTLTVTDDKGASNMCTAMVTVVDTLPPIINISLCPGEVYLGVTASVSVDVVDTCSGVLSQSVPNGLNLLDTSTVGTKTFTVTAADNAGNTSSNACTYNVIYDFLGAGGFRKPINNPPVLNTAKAGSTIPVKWQLPDGQGGFISDLGVVEAIQFQQVNCANISTTLTDPVETTATGETVLRYDLMNNQYIYNWLTSKSWAGNCYVLLLSLNDGKQYRANFLLK
jgi:hypothetical protein